ncbi:lipopolysaccharide-binding protein-like [Actinia tenebrosa]|uniref:Lipopolysaccharide-binding protein-like n=1 Tax=Actinia tenebrosa TaxID=6105 RepID=A0A6P8HSF6_ACTTE|nr:lipopolysaccharide-binding protein-like [Actinia tenebrosa]
MATKNRWKCLDFSVLSLLSFCVLIVLLIPSSYGKPVDLSPEWRSEISEQASNYAEHVALPFVVKQLNDLQVPKVTGDVKTPLGKVNYNLHNITLSDVIIKKANISLQSGHSVRMRADQASFKIGADWNYKEDSWPHISDSGSCHLSIGDLTLGLSFLVLDVSKGQHNVRVDDCNLRIGSLGITFQGGASWLYNLFSNEIAKDLRKQLEKEICKAAVKIIDSKANTVLASLPGMVEALKAME